MSLPPRPLPLCPPSPPLPSPARRETCRHPGGGGRKGTFAGMLWGRKIPERLSGRVPPPGAGGEVHLPAGFLPFPPAPSAERPRRAPGAGTEAASALPGGFCARAARRRWDAVISIHGRCIFFNATSLFQLVADGRIRFPILFAFPVLWRIKIFVCLQSVSGRLN